MGNIIKYAEAMFNNGTHFMLQTGINYFRQYITINSMSFFIANCFYSLFSPLDPGRIKAIDNRFDSLDAIIYRPGVFYDHPAGSFFTQIGKLRQHFIGGSKIKGGLGFCIIITLTSLDNDTENLMMGFQKVYITGSNNRFIKIFSQFNDQTIVVFQCFQVSCPSIINKKLIVGQGLDLQIIIKRRYLLQFRSFSSCNNGTV